MKRSKSTAKGVVDTALELSAGTLRGRQSVRATFRLPEQMIALLRVAAEQLGVKQKSLIDQLVGDRDVLDKIAASSKGDVPTEEKRRQKTFVLSRKSLKSLDEVAKRYGITRDILVEVSLCRLIPVVSSEQEKYKKRKAFYTEIEKYLESGSKLLDKAGAELGEDDRLHREFEKLIRHAESNLDGMKGFIKDKNTIDLT